MYLIENHKHGRPIPSVLPPNLIPPSFRSGVVSSGSEELDALQREVEKLILERREADQQIVQLEADMTVKNSEIKNLKIELTTLQDTVLQLERQKGEAAKRLEALDLQVVQLEHAVEQSKEKVKEEEARLNELRAQCARKDDRVQTQELLQAQKEVQALEDKKQALSAALAHRNAAIESASLQLTKLKKATERLRRLIESKDIETIKKEQNELFATLTKISPIVENQGFPGAAFHTDPFASATRQDVVFECDPFASSNSTPFASFDAFSGKDPFSSEQTVKSPSAYQASSTKAPPPRPAPPKTRQTPVNAIEPDPFSGS
ncbi:unnamed protein product [Gongylonema pulchrum]|uniref:EH domain-containing protein n=1 Tax=Gongylonema pulchrum TaxID=637853 RepID=A0A183ECP1_9BILA|nr:unnamed protein product [Gongylonema pulchrum]